MEIADVDLTTAIVTTESPQSPQPSPQPSPQQQEQGGETTDHTTRTQQQHPDVDVDKTLRDAEEFLANFASLRDENEQLKQANQHLEVRVFAMLPLDVPRASLTL